MNLYALKFKLGLFSTVSLFIFGIFSGSLSAQEMKSLGQSKDWAAFSVNVDGGKNCFVVSQPKNTEPKGLNRDPAYFFVTYRPKDNISNQVSVVTGHQYKENSKTSVQIGSERFSLFTRGDKAWIEDVSQQSKLVAAMRKGSNMIVRGTSSRGTRIVDTYSLFGITAALQNATGACR